MECILLLDKMKHLAEEFKVASPIGMMVDSVYCFNLKVPFLNVPILSFFLFILVSLQLPSPVLKLANSVFWKEKLSLLTADEY